VLENTPMPPDPAPSRDWLAALLLRRHDRLMPRFATALTRLRAAPRGWRRRLHRRAAVSLAGAALLLAMAGSPLLVPRAHAATINVANGAITVNAGDATCSLIEAIRNANSDSDTSGGDCAPGSGADVISLPAGGAFNFTTPYFYSYGNNGLPVISTEMTIQGNGSTLDLGGSAVRIRLARVNATGDLTLADATVSGGYMYDATYGGGVFRVDGGELTIDGSTLEDNATRSYGGAIFVRDDGTLLVTNGSTISGNTAFRGGGIYSRDSATTIEDSSVSGNYAERTGGGVQGNGGSLSISGSLINDNGWQPGQIGVTGEVDYGGGVFTDKTALEILDSTIDGNYGGYGGGGVRIHRASDVAIDGVTISNNVADSGGGGVQWGAFGDSGAYAATGAITNTTISGNTSAGQGRGGGIFVLVGELTLNNVTISDNTAEEYNGYGGYGSGVYVDNSASLTLNRTIISGNEGVVADEIYVYDGTYGAGTVTANNFNLFGHSGLTNAAAFTNFTPGATDITATSNGTQPTALASILAGLADNGGPTTPATQTHALVGGSPAIDGAPSAACTVAPVSSVDQRDVARPQDGDGAPSSNECDIGAYEYVFVPTDTICPAPGNELTTLLGVGMGDTKKAKLKAKLTIPNASSLVGLYGQLVGKDVGADPRYVRFYYPGGYTQIDDFTGTSVRPGGLYWFGGELPNKPWIKGQWFLAKSTKAKVPRAFVLYATRTTTDSYFNTYAVFTDGATNTVGPAAPWAQTQTFTIPIDPPLAPADITVQVALVDNDADGRALTVIASAGGVDDMDVSLGPTHKPLLNLITFTLEDVPAGTDEVTIELNSSVEGDSAAITGAAVNYVCETD